MAGDTQVALQIRTGCPRIIDYRQRHEPFFEVRQFLVRHLFVEERTAEYLKLVALKQIGCQGYPGLGVVTEYVEAMEQQASLAVKTFGRAYLPWMHWPTPEEEEKLAKAKLASEADELINAWKQRFEPENGPAQGSG